MSDCGLLLERGSTYRQGQCEVFIICSSGQAWLWISVMAPLFLDSLLLDATSVLH
jgi:hypothetical protein